MSDGKWSFADTTDLLRAEVLALLAEGKSLRAVGKELNLSKSKVERIKNGAAQRPVFATSLSPSSASWKRDRARDS